VLAQAALYTKDDEAFQKWTALMEERLIALHGSAGEGAFPLGRAMAG
jgi:hypothetical protein